VKVAICGYGAGNVRSVEIAFRRLGAELTTDVAGADLAVLPGVGSARAAMDGLRERGHDVALCEYGAGNVRSVVVAFQRLGVDATVTSEPADVERADLAVLPGVGSARSAMSELRGQGLDVALRQRLDESRPVLGICLGLQLAVDFSEEDGGVEGLGLLPGRAVRVQAERVPRIGWAEVDGTAFYFAHSYCVETSCATAWSDGIVAEARHGSFLGVQFHPEKSGAAGARYLDGVLKEVREQSLSRA
jgi:glutamine amidotransferase